MVDRLRENPEETFHVITDNLFEVPPALDFRDLDAPLGQLLASVADLVRDLLIPKMTKGFWGTRWLYISSAAASQSPHFTPTIIGLLLDRSIYVKTLVLNLILQWPHLRVSEAMPKLEKLSGMKAFQDSEMDRELLEKVKQSILSSKP